MAVLPQVERGMIPLYFPYDLRPSVPGSHIGTVEKHAQLIAQSKKKAEKPVLQKPLGSLKYLRKITMFKNGKPW